MIIIKHTCIETTPSNIIDHHWVAEKKRSKDSFNCLGSLDGHRGSAPLQKRSTFAGDVERIGRMEAERYWNNVCTFLKWPWSSFTRQLSKWMVAGDRAMTKRLLVIYRGLMGRHIRRIQNRKGLSSWEALKQSGCVPYGRLRCKTDMQNQDSIVGQDSTCP